VQALETIKLILGAGRPLIGRMVHFDTLSMEIRVNKLPKDPECPMCGKHRRSPSSSTTKSSADCGTRRARGHARRRLTSVGFGVERGRGRSVFDADPADARGP
jgi:hypothetical protein